MSETIALAPVTLRRSVLRVLDPGGETDLDYTATVNEVTFVPDVTWVWLPEHGKQAGTPAPGRVRWTALIGYAQDFTTPDALTIYLVEHAAQRRQVVFTPVTGGRRVTADVLIVPGRLGGPSGEILAATAQLPLYGAPTIGEG